MDTQQARRTVQQARTRDDLTEYQRIVLDAANALWAAGTYPDWREISKVTGLTKSTIGYIRDVLKLSGLWDIPDNSIYGKDNPEEIRRRAAQVRAEHLAEKRANNYKERHTGEQMRVHKLAELRR